MASQPVQATVDNWERSISFTLGKEGGMNFTVQPDGSYKMKPASASDPGGPTNIGITLPTLAAAISSGVVPANTKLHTMTKEQAKAIYKKTTG
jgi:lysozyme family protein